MKKYFLLLLVLFAFLAGCSEKISNYDYYHYAVFNKDGKIVCLKGIGEDKYNAINTKIGESYGEYIVKTDILGSVEALYNNVTSDVPRNFTANPKNDLFAYGSDIRSGIINKIVIINLPAGSYTGLKKAELNVLNVKAFDWDNTGEKIIYSNTAGEIREIAIDGTNDSLLTREAANEISSKYGNRLYFTYTSSGESLLAYVSQNGSNKHLVDVEISNISIGVSSYEVFGIKNNSYIKVDATNPLAPLQTVIISSVEGDNPSISPDAKFVSYDGVYAPGTFGVWLYEVSSGEKRRLN